MKLKTYESMETDEEFNERADMLLETGLFERRSESIWRLFIKDTSFFYHVYWKGWFSYREKNELRAEDFENIIEIIKDQNLKIKLLFHLDLLLSL